MPTELFFFPFSFSSYFLSIGCQYCFWWLESIFLRTFLCSLLVVVSMYLRYQLISPFPPSFLDTYSHSASFLRCFLLWLTKNGHRYLMSWTTQVFIRYIRFLIYSLVSSIFCSSEIHFFISFFIYSCLLVSASVFPSICTFPFPRIFKFFLDLVIPFLPSYVIFRFVSDFVCLSLEISIHLFRLTLFHSLHT